MDKEKTLCQALNAPDEDKALLRINELKAAQKELNDIAAAFNCEAKAEAVIKAAGETKADPAKFVEIDKVTELTRELNEIKAERAEEKAENAVNAAIRDGRLPPVLKDNAKEICKKNGRNGFKRIHFKNAQNILAVFDRRRTAQVRRRRFERRRKGNLRNHGHFIGNF